MREIVSSALGPASLADCLTLAACSEACSEAVVAASLIASATDCIAASSAVIVLAIATVILCIPKHIVRWPSTVSFCRTTGRRRVKLPQRSRYCWKPKQPCDRLLDPQPNKTTRAPVWPQTTLYCRLLRSNTRAYRGLSE